MLRGINTGLTYIFVGWGLADFNRKIQQVIWDAVDSDPPKMHRRPDSLLLCEDNG